MQFLVHDLLVNSDEPPAASQPGLRETKKSRTRATLARAALSLVAEEGLGATTVEAIAARADVSPRTFFNYFDSKDEAVVHLGAFRFRHLMERVFAQDDTEQPGAAPTNPVMRIRDVMLSLLRDTDPAAAADDDLFRVALDRDPALFGALHTSLQAVGEEFEALIVTRYASVRDRDLARVGLSLALGLTQAAMLDVRAGRCDSPIDERVADLYEVLESAFTETTTATDAAPLASPERSPRS